MSLLRITAGIISQPASGSLHRPPWPTGPSLQAGYSVPLISATTVRSASLARTPWLHLIGLYRRPCPTTWSGLRTTPSLLWVSVPSTRAVTSTPGGESGPYPRPATLLHGLPHQNSESAPPMFPTSASVGALLSTLLPVFALATARAVARPPGPIRPGETSLSGRRGLFYPSFPAEGHPSRESDIATRRPGTDTVTGLSPVGALPLQAARFGEGQARRRLELLDSDRAGLSASPRCMVIRQLSHEVGINRKAPELQMLERAKVAR